MERKQCVYVDGSYCYRFHPSIRTHFTSADNLPILCGFAGNQVIILNNKIYMVLQNYFKNL